VDGGSSNDSEASPRPIVDQQVDSALARMTKKTVRHWQKEDEFCLTFEEQQRLIFRLPRSEVADEMFNAKLRAALSEQAAQMEIQITDSAGVYLSPGYASSLIISVTRGRGVLLRRLSLEMFEDSI